MNLHADSQAARHLPVGRTLTGKPDWITGITGKLPVIIGKKIYRYCKLRSGGKDMSFALLRVGSEMNRSGLSGAYGSVEKLVELAAEMEPSDEFRELWEKFESDVLSVWADGPEAREPLRELLENLPVGYVDRASAFRLDSDMELLELCAFRVVAASVKKNFPEAADWVTAVASRSF